MSDFSFRLLKQSATGARRGIIHTLHGQIETPAFVPVGTQGNVKSLCPEDLVKLKVQIFFVNTYHIMIRPGIDVIKKFKGLHNFIGWKGPLFTDSGGFQIFSLGKGNLVKIDNSGVTFRSHWDGERYRLTPEKSIEIQHILGGDMMIAFDDCTPYPATLDKATISLVRTHRWALASLKKHQELVKKKIKTALYGSIQGSVYKDLRVRSTKFISSLPFDGFAIGGVAVGETKKEMADVLSWVVPLLPQDKPRHLLGVGEIDDIFKLVRAGIDTFDCVMPTRLARMGHLLVNDSKNKWEIDITKKSFSQGKEPIDKNCVCFVCLNFSKAYLHHLFKVKELLAYRLATIHNLYFIEELMRKIRNAIKEENLEEIMEEYL